MASDLSLHCLSTSYKKEAWLIWVKMGSICFDFFVNEASKIKEPITPSIHDKLKDFCSSKISQDTSFVIPTINKERVLKYLLS